MAMTRKQRRGILIFTCFSVLCLAVGLVLVALNDSVVFFYSPTEIVEKKIKPGQRFRLGGLVKDGSVVRGQGTKVQFAVYDANRSVNVTFEGILPDLFREGQGVVTEGRLSPDGSFVADTVLAKHDENYMPREVADTLKKQGVWQGKDKKEEKK